MPWGDGTGPWGLGPMTGRGFGYCAGFPHPGFVVPFPRGGRWIGRGWFWRGYWGRGWRWLFPPMGFRRFFAWSRVPYYYWYPFW